MNQLKSILIDALTQFWEERQERERQYIIAAIATLVVALIYLIGIDPAISGQKELSKSLPILHQQSVEMKQLAQELKSLPNPDNLHEVSRDTVSASLKRNNLKPESLSVIDGAVRAQFESISMAALQTWLLEMQTSSGLFVQEMKITAADEGMINATLMLQQSGSGG